MTEALDLIERARGTLPGGSDQAIWTAIQLIEAAVSMSSYADAEEPYVRRLKEAASAYMLARREGLNADPMHTNNALFALESCMKKTTTGVDGFKRG